jgi:hypothetical protein
VFRKHLRQDATRAKTSTSQIELITTSMFQYAHVAALRACRAEFLEDVIREAGVSENNTETELFSLPLPRPVHGVAVHRAVWCKVRARTRSSNL